LIDQGILINAYDAILAKRFYQLIQFVSSQNHSTLLSIHYSCRLHRFRNSTFFSESDGESSLHGSCA
jgi:hypothetical protein